MIIRLLFKTSIVIFLFFIFSGCASGVNKKKSETPNYHKDQAQEIIKTNNKNRDANEKHARETQEKKQKALNEKNKTSSKNKNNIKKSRFNFY